ncbi:JmjC domain-containing protein [Lyngbya aestuarii]|uniref:JmjC domain-containing protein n=1 Tax=Lyngbya aestuarii TaxID=118322 RepID=UPI00403D576F
MNSLINLLKPYSVEEFLNTHWTSKALFVPSGEKSKFAHLFSWEKLNYLLNFHQFKYPELRLALDGKVLDESKNKDITKLCQEGATLIVNQVNKFIPEIAAFATEVTYDLGYGTQVNSYCSWPGRQGFSSHYDTHEVFILQIEGRKEWHVFPDTFKYPLVDQKSASLTPPEGEPYLSCTLSPGDVLYIPRGHWHYAVALNEPSLHLTLGVHCQTGVDFLEWLIGELRQQEKWRRNLPLRLDKVPVESYLDSLKEDLDKYIYHNNIAHEYISYLDSLGRPIAKYSLPQQAGFNIFPQGTQTLFTVPALQRVTISELPEGNGCKIIVSGKEVSLKGVPRSFAETIFNKECFMGNEVMSWLPDYDWEIDIVPLLYRLVIEGIVFVETTTNQ